MTNIYKDHIYLGFIHIEKLESAFAQMIVKERNEHGDFSGLEDFINRLGPGLEQCIILIRAGAFRFTGKSKALLLWEAHLLINKSKKEPACTLFSTEQKHFEMPVFEQTALEDAYDEIEILGFPVTLSWFDMLQTKFRGEITSAGMKDNVGKKVRMTGHLITVKYIKTVKNEWMNFGCFIDPDGEFFDTTHFSRSLKNYPFRGSGTYLLLGKIVDEFGYKTMEVEKMAKLPVKADPRY